MNVIIEVGGAKEVEVIAVSESVFCHLLELSNAVGLMSRDIAKVSEIVGRVRREVGASESASLCALGLAEKLSSLSLALSNAHFALNAGLPDLEIESRDLPFAKLPAVKRCA